MQGSLWNIQFFVCFFCFMQIVLVAYSHNIKLLLRIPRSSSTSHECWGTYCHTVLRNQLFSFMCRVTDSENNFIDVCWFSNETRTLFCQIFFSSCAVCGLRSEHGDRFFPFFSVYILCIFFPSHSAVVCPFCNIGSLDLKARKFNITFFVNRSWQETTGGRRHNVIDLGVENWMRHSLNVFFLWFNFDLCLLFNLIRGPRTVSPLLFSSFISILIFFAEIVLGKAFAPQTSWKCSCYEISLSGWSSARRWTPLSVTKVPSVRFQCQPSISFPFRKKKNSPCPFVNFFFLHLCSLELKMSASFHSYQRI